MRDTLRARSGGDFRALRRFSSPKGRPRGNYSAVRGCAESRLSFFGRRPLADFTQSTTCPSRFHPVGEIRWPRELNVVPRGSHSPKAVQEAFSLFQTAPDLVSMGAIQWLSNADRYSSTSEFLRLHDALRASERQAKTSDRDVGDRCGKR